MQFQQILLFISTALLLALAPGPDNLGVLSLGVSTGRRAAMGFAVGCAAGCLNHTLLAVAGVSALIAASPTAFRAAQWIGAAYLCWIGYQTLRSLFSQRTLLMADAPTTINNSAWTYFKRGLIANAINPKVAIFFLAFLPQFVSRDGWPGWAQLATLGGLFSLCAGFVFVLVALGADWIGAKIRANPSVNVLLEGATAILFFGLAIRLAIADFQPVTPQKFS